MRRKSLLSAPSCSNSRRRRRQEPRPGVRAAGAEPAPPPDGSAPPGGWPGSASREARAESGVQGTLDSCRAPRLVTRSSTAGSDAGNDPRDRVSAQHGPGTRDTARGRAPRVGAVLARSGQGALWGRTVGDGRAPLPGRHQRVGALPPQPSLLTALATCPQGPGRPVGAVRDLTLGWTIPPSQKLELGVPGRVGTMLQPSLEGRGPPPSSFSFSF